MDDEFLEQLREGLANWRRPTDKELWEDISPYGDSLGPRYFDRRGNGISMGTWAELMRDWDYKAIEQTQFRYWEQSWKVSTVWLGLDHGMGFGAPPLIFETMVFGGSLDGTQERYASEEHARVGHHLIVQAAQDVPLLQDIWWLFKDCIREADRNHVRLHRPYRYWRQPNVGLTGEQG
jgi:hypothetical protein